jgi:flagellar motor switch protein FliN/FliY
MDNEVEVEVEVDGDQVISESDPSDTVPSGEDTANDSGGEQSVVVDSEQSAQGMFPDLADNAVAPDGSSRDLSMIMDIPVELTVELGRTRIPIKNILQLAQGAVVELDALAGEPMDVLVNGCLIAQGEVVVVNDKFGVRLTDIVTPSERIKRMQRG